MRLLLIQPPVIRNSIEEEHHHRTPVQPPLSLMYLSAYLKEHTSHVIKVIDALGEGYDAIPFQLPDGKVQYGLSDQALIEIIKGFNPVVVGVTCVFSNQAESFHKMFELVKQNSKAITVAGGVHATTCPELVMWDENIDYLIRHDGEEAFLKLLDYLEGHEKIIRVPNLIYRETVFLIRNQIRFVEDFDSLPFPDRDCVPLPKYYSKIGSVHGSHTDKQTISATIIATKGCALRCDYCAGHIVSGHKIRRRKPENFCDEIEILINKYNVTHLNIEDDELNASKTYFKEILREMQARGFGSKLTWSAPNGLLVHGIDDEIAGLMKATGCSSVSLGLESGSPRVLKELMNKPLNLGRVKPAVQSLRKAGIRTMLFVIIGNIGDSPEQDETKEEIWQTFKFCADTGADWYGIHILTPLPGTKTWDRAAKRVDGFELSHLKYSISNIPSPNWSKDWLEHMQDLMNRFLCFSNNINIQEKAYPRAIADFSRVVSLYPDLEHGQKALAMAKYDGGPWDAGAFFSEAELTELKKLGERILRSWRPELASEI